ncbi:TPA: hypothetical protein N6818_003690 [Escherichia coli]|nr:hypothetical protein [Escherichia coli]
MNTKHKARALFATAQVFKREVTAAKMDHDLHGTQATKEELTVILSSANDVLNLLDDYFNSCIFEKQVMESAYESGKITFEVYSLYQEALNECSTVYKNFLDFLKPFKEA